jgi:dolichyl-phosphate-mannose-protein mannosyltransferase
MKAILLRLESWLEHNTHLVYTFLLLMLGVMTFGFQFTVPNNTQWDEVYYIPPVARYQKGIFFMESHPPLGKLVLTLGDVIFGGNKSIDTSTIVNYDTLGGGGDLAGAKDDLPEGYSFFGIRFFPVVAAIVIPLIVMAIIRLITAKDWLGFVGGVLVVLDNALVLHFRAAMLDSILILLMLSALYYCIKGVKDWMDGKEVSRSTIVLATVLTGLAISTKYNALILLAPLFVLCVVASKSLPIKRTTFWGKLDYYLFRFADGWTRFIISMVGVGVIFVSIWGVHFAIARHYDSNLYNKEGFFAAGDTLKANLKDKGRLTTPLDFVYAISSGINYTLNYHAGVPSFEKCEQEAIAENKVCNGSKPWMWLTMSRSINFRWSKFAVENKTRETISLDDYNKLSDESKSSYTVKTSYYTLIGNPVVWLLSLIGLVTAFVTIMWGVVVWLWKKQRPSQSWWWVVLLFGLWAGYMAMAIPSTRIIYLYHYFFPLIVSFALLAILIHHYKLDDKKWFQAMLSVVLIAVVGGFLWFAPFTYAIPISSQQFDWRNWLPWWAIIKA